MISSIASKLVLIIDTVHEMVIAVLIGLHVLLTFRMDLVSSYLEHFPEFIVIYKRFAQKSVKTCCDSIIISI